MTRFSTDNLHDLCSPTRGEVFGTMFLGGEFKALYMDAVTTLSPDFLSQQFEVKQLARKEVNKNADAPARDVFKMCEIKHRCTGSASLFERCGENTGTANLLRRAPTTLTRITTAVILESTSI